MESLVPVERGFEPEAYGKYFLIDKVAVGGMAEVFRAKTFSHGGFEKLLVIKRILQHLSDNSEFVEMFIDEAKISVMLQQPNIVQVYDFGRIRENYFIAMECVEGKDLKILLRKLAERRKLLPIEFAVFIAHEVCKGLDYAHKKTTLKGDPMGIVHRDMSPSNILISYSGEVKIADFGIAKAETSVYNTKDGVLKGKFEYMSPEQASGQSIDARSDLFSVGIMLHEMLTGRRLFKSESELRTLERIKAVDVKPPSETNPNVPSRLDDLVMKALARDPKDRYQDGKEMQADLLEFLYPATPDITRDSLSHFMQQTFITELAEERDRMEQGTKAAQKLWEEEPELDLEPAWQEGGSASTMTRPASRLPLAIAVVLLLVAGGAAVYFATRTVAPTVVKEEAPKPTTGSLDLRITPAVPAHVWLGDQDLGVGPTITWDKVPPGQDLTLKVQADGYQLYTDTVNLAAGEHLRLPVALVAVAAPVAATPAPAPSHDTTGPPMLFINSTPSGAGVYLDGKRAGTTPFSMSDGTGGSRYNVELRLDGYDSERFNATFPNSGRVAFARTLSATAAAATPGHVSVNVSKGWADVYIDGQKIDSTPLANHEISAGTHTIRVLNAGASIDQTRSVKISSGKDEKVFFPID